MKIKSAIDILHQNGFTAQVGDEDTEFVVAFDDALEAMKEYAAQFIDLAAEEATHNVEIDWIDPYDYSAGHNGIKGNVDKESILKIKEQIK